MPVAQKKTNDDTDIYVSSDDTYYANADVYRKAVIKKASLEKLRTIIVVSNGGRYSSGNKNKELGPTFATSCSSIEPVEEILHRSSTYAFVKLHS